MRVHRLHLSKARRAAIVAAAALTLTAIGTVTANASVVNVTPMTSFRQVALADFGGPLYMAWVGDNANHTLNIAYSTDGITFSHSIQPFGQGNSDSAPALAVFSGKLWMAWTGTDSNHTLNLASSSNGTTWSQATRPLGKNNSVGGPALAAFNGKLYYGWQGTDSGGHINIASSADGVHFSAPAQPGGNTTFRGLALFASSSINGLPASLWISWPATDSNHTIWVAQTTDGVNLFNQHLLSGIGTNHQPSISKAPSGNALIIDYTAHDDNLAAVIYNGQLVTPTPAELTGPIIEAPAVAQTGNYGTVHAWVDRSDEIWIMSCSDGPPPPGQQNVGSPFC